MKKFIFFIVSIVLLLYSFKIKNNSKQNNYWPLIKGKWYFVKELPDGYITILSRNGPASMQVFNFLTDDSCTFRVKGADDIYKLKYFTYFSKHDSLFFFSKKDTLIIKLLLLNNEELKIKPLYP